MSQTELMHSTRTKALAAERLEYSVYATLAYLPFLVAACFGRLSARRAGARRRSVFGEALEGVHATIPWVFSGR